MKRSELMGLMPQKMDYYQYLKDNRLYRNLLTSLYEDYYGILSAFSYTITQNLEDSKDISSTVFELLMKYIDKIQIQTVNPWLIQVTKHKSIDTVRKRKMHNFHVTRFANMHKSYDNMELEIFTLEETQAYEKRISKVKFHMAQMKKQQRECIGLHYLEKKSYQEIAEQFNFPKSTVKSKIQNGIRMLRIFQENDSTRYNARKKTVGILKTTQL
jgi:RNA polymerase sigma factor (sigma-70 family)